MHDSQIPDTVRQINIRTFNAIIRNSSKEIGFIIFNQPFNPFSHRYSGWELSSSKESRGLEEDHQAIVLEYCLAIADLMGLELVTEEDEKAEDTN